MNLRREHFNDFFAEAHAGRQPYRWQQRLLEHVLEHGRWPQQIVAPTGAGKTAAIDVHVFAMALTAADGVVHIPRRLALVVDRRALTDSQYDYARALSEALRAAQPGSVLGEVAAVLRELRQTGPGDADAEPLLIRRLRGGVPPDRDWRDDPTACAVLCCTPAMWGSRVLMRGYGSTRAARPREAGLLALDCVAVVDEAHLSQQLITTARRVGELTAMTDQAVGVPPLQVVETTATAGELAPGWSYVGVKSKDVAVRPDGTGKRNDEALAKRMLAAKELRAVSVPDWPLAKTGAKRRKTIRHLSDLTAELFTEFGRTVCCYVNTVDAAVEVGDELSRRGYEVGVFCGRMRPHDLHHATERLHGNQQPFDIVVSTQTLEVGVDCDFSAAVTELAAGSALAQRAGRVNRSGNRDSSAVVVVVPDSPPSAHSGPYTPDELEAARKWLAELPDNICPWTVASNPPRPAALKRMLPQRLELMDVDFLSCTDVDRAADHDVDLWLAEDDAVEDRDLGVVVRTGMPTDPDEAISLVTDVPAQAHEVFPARVATMRDAVGGLTEQGLRVVRVRGEEVSLVESPEDLGTGDLVVVDTTARLFRSGVVAPGPQAGTESDVLESRAEPPVGEVVLRVGDGSRVPREAAAELLTFAAQEQDSLATRETRARLADLLDELALDAPPETLQAATRLLADGRIRDCEIILCFDADDQPQRLVVRDMRRAARDESVRQTWTGAETPVTLREHNTRVGQQARRLAHALRLPDPLPDVLEAAGAHHDDGKADPRFQRWLGAIDPTAEAIAKSPTRSAAQRRADQRASGLPRGWRHEQLSALHYARDHSTADPHHALIARLVGTSHGHGRRTFADVASRLLPPDHPDVELATALFDDGAWEELIDATHRRWGYWGCAYLEALLRAADTRVSMEDA